LEQKQVQPPTRLAPIASKQKASKSKKSNEEVEMIFEEGCHFEKGVLADEDYTEANKTYNRVKNYSFTRDLM
jgi:hypothetical protein